MFSTTFGEICGSLTISLPNKEFVLSAVVVSGFISNICFVVAESIIISFYVKLFIITFLEDKELS